MADNPFGNFQEAVWNAIRSAVRVGVVGRKNADGTTTITVDGRPHYIYVRTGATQTGGEILEAYNKGIPRLAGAPVLLIKWSRVWTVVGVDADSPAVTPTTFSVAYHQHLRDNGLAQSVNDLEGMPSTLAGRAGALLRVNDDEDGYYLADSASGGTGTVDSVNGEVGDVVLDSDDIAEGVTNLYFTAAEETKLAGIEALADVTDAVNVGSSIHGAAAKTTPVDADTMPLIDSAASNVLKKVTWANIKATLLTYFSTLFAVLAGTAGGQHLKGGTAAGEDLTLEGTAHATKTSSFVLLQPNGGDVGVGTIAPDALIHGRKDVNNTATMLLSNAAANAFSSEAIYVGESLLLSGVLYGGVRWHNNSWSPGAGNEALAANGLALYARSGAAGGINIVNGHASSPIRFYVGGQAAANEVARLTTTGLSIFVTSPQGPLHIHDGTSGKLFVTKTGVAGTAVTVIPDGAGDVTAGLVLSSVVRASSGVTQGSAPASAVTPGLTVQIYANGSDIVTFAVAANGSVTVQRTGGSLTYTVTLNMIWQ